MTWPCAMKTDYYNSKNEWFHSSCSLWKEVKWTTATSWQGRWSKEHRSKEWKLRLKKSGWGLWF